MRFLAILTIALFFTHQTIGATEDWLRRLEERRFAAFRSADPWPYLDPFERTHVAKIPESADGRLAHLVVRLTTRQVERWQLKTGPALGDLTAVVRAAEKIGAPGGYTNLLLADTLWRVAISGAGRAMVRSPGLAAQLRDLSRKCASPKFDAEILGSIVEKEYGIDERASIKEAFREDRGTGMRRALQVSNQKTRRTAMESAAALLDRRSLADLVSRQVYTEIFARSGVEALSEFLARGGDIARLRNEGDGYLTKVLGEYDWKKWESPTGEETRLNARGLLYQVDIWLKGAYCSDPLCLTAIWSGEELQKRLLRQAEEAGSGKAGKK